MLILKMLRDMKNHLGQFISIFIMAFLASFVFSGINAEWYGMQTEVENFYQETNLADIWLIASSFNSEDESKVKKLSGVKDTSLRLSYDCPLYTDNDKVLTINVIEENTLSLPSVTEGSPLNTTLDGIWLDESYAKTNKLNIGDQIQLDIPGTVFTKEILGFILHPEYIYSSKDSGSFMPDHENYGFIFLYSSSLPDNFDIEYNQLLLSLTKDANEENLYQELEGLFSDRFMLIMDEDSHLSISSFNNEIEQNKAMGGVFPIVFFLIAALTILTTMTRMTNSQRTQIGTLKALGFSKNRILIHYVSYGIWLGLIGGLLGLLIGPLIIPPILFIMQKSIYTLPNWSIAISPSSFIIVVLLAFSCGLASYLACQGQLKEVPAALLRPKAPKNKVHQGLERSKIWYKLSFGIQWNLRDIIRSRIRSLMAIIGVIGCTSLLLFGLGLRDTINKVSQWMYEDLNVYEDKINIDPKASSEDITLLTNSYSGQLIQEASIELKFKSNKVNGLLTVAEQGDKIRFEDTRGERIALPDRGIGISQKMAEQLNSEIGDIIEWRIYGQKDWIESEISVIYRTPMGQGIAINKEVYEETGQSFMPSSLLTSDIVSNTSMKAIENTLNKNNLMNSFNDLLESIRMIVVILIMGAIILGSVVLYNLGALSYTERIRELATLKVMGFHPRLIRSLLSMQNIWLTVLGIIIGVPIGFWLVDFMLSTMPASLDMRTYISLESVTISVLGTFIVSIAVNILLSRNIKKINMVSALKSVE